MTDLLALARARVSTRTHYDGCEADHVECLIHALADEIERLRDWQRRAVQSMRWHAHCEVCAALVAEVGAP